MAVSKTQARSRARRGAVQAIYQWQVGGGSSASIRTEFRERDGMKDVDWAFFDTLVDGVIKDCDELDSALLPLLDREIDALDPVERAILRISTHEFRSQLEVPFKVVINEGVQLARVFGADKSHRYINGVLDVLGRKLRPNEAQAK
ncbi:MAG: N utilization substance protein B [Gammaproteobacteria bacterium]|jgi:N utilization substance protein B